MKILKLKIHADKQTLRNIVEVPGTALCVREQDEHD